MRPSVRHFTRGAVLTGSAVALVLMLSTRVEAQTIAPDKTQTLEAPKGAAPAKKDKDVKPGTKTAAGASGYDNKVHQRINQTAAGRVPRGALTQKTVRIPYVIVIGASGQLLSKSVSTSGVPALDKAVLDALAKSAPFPPPPTEGGPSYRVSGAIVYRVH